MEFCTLTWTASQADAGSPPAGPNPTEQCWTHWFSVFCAFRGFLLNNSRSEISFFSHYLYAVVMASNMDVFQPHFPVHTISSTSIVNDFYIVMDIAWMTTFHHLASCCSGLTSKAASLYLQILRCERVSESQINWQNPCRVPCTCTSSSDWTYQSFEAVPSGQLWSMISTHFVSCFLASARFQDMF